MIRKRFVMMSVLMSVLLVSYLFSDVKNPDKPLKGEWDFQLKKVWEIDSAGDDVLARPVHLLVNDEGSIYLYDRKNRKLYMFKKNGEFLKIFAPQGEGPGELRTFYDAYLFKGKLIVISFFKIHYFTQAGDYLHFVECNIDHYYPRYFLTEDDFIHYSTGRTRLKGLERSIGFYNYKTKKEKKLIEYMAYEGGVAWEGGRVITITQIAGVSPFMVATFDKDRFYYGFNNNYEIKAADYDTGKTLLAFSLDRKKKKLTDEDIEDFFKKNPPPRVDLHPSWIKQIKNSLPREETFFSRMEIHNKLLYVHVSYLDRQLKQQQLDIFTPEGKYLYRAFIRAPEGTHIVAGPHPVFLIKNNHLYITLEEEAGEGNVTLAKYEITLPKL